MANLDLPGLFVSDVNIPLSAADLNMLREAAIILDGLTFRRLNACCSNGAQTSDGNTSEFHSRGDYRQSWWGLYYRTGMTTLTIEGKNANQLDFYLGGVFNSSQAAAPGGFTKNITLSGYSDGDVVLLEIKTNGNPSGAPAGYTPKYIIYDVYGGPISVSSAWGGVPTFAGTYSATLLNQLTDAAQYIWDRVTAVPIPAFITSIDVAGSHKLETLKLFDGSVGRYASNEVLRVLGTIYCRTNAEHYTITYNGSLAHTSATYTAGQTAAISVPIALTHTTGTRAEVSIASVVEDNTYALAPGVFSTYRLQLIRSEPDSSGYATATPPTAFTAEESISAATLNSRLNTIATMLSDAKARLDARPELWNRARAMRRTFAKDDTQVARNFKRHAATFIRQGDTLIVRGRGVKVAFGAITTAVPDKEDTPIDYKNFSWAVEQSVGEGGGGGGNDEKSATAVIPLDTIEGLEPGMRYQVFGQTLEYAGEFIGSV